VRGDGATALSRLKALRREASRKTRAYTVKPGDTLSEIAEREEVYGNSLLWPLIWQANRKAIPDPNRLRAGQKLRIRVSPTVEEVVEAIGIARRNTGKLSIGEVLEVLP
jgi:nucleoid-associated protein YgaU